MNPTLEVRQFCFDNRGTLPTASGFIVAGSSRVRGVEREVSDKGRGRGRKRGDGATFGTDKRDEKVIFEVILRSSIHFLH